MYYVILFQGIFSENKDKLIMAALQALVQKEGDQKTVTAVELEAQFQALRRLVANKVGYAAFTSLPGLVKYLFILYKNLGKTLNIVTCSFREAIGLKVIAALRRNDQGVTHAAIDMICALMHPMHDDYDLRQEQTNKSSLLQKKVFLESLLNMWTTHVVCVIQLSVI